MLRRCVVVSVLSLFASNVLAGENSPYTGPMD
jgi:hypothetical protein